MKKMFVILAVLALVFASVSCMAETVPFSFRNNITFGMNMDEVIAAETGYYEIDHERTRGPVSFTELEYENVTVNNVRADLSYLFADNRLAAIRIGFDTRDVSYEQVKADLTEKYGEAGAPDMNLLGSGVYAVDDDGYPEGRTEAIVSGNIMIVLELDDDDIDVTYVDLSAGYIK